MNAHKIVVNFDEFAEQWDIVPRMGPFEDGLNWKVNSIHRDSAREERAKAKACEGVDWKDSEEPWNAS